LVEEAVVVVEAVAVDIGPLLGQHLGEAVAEGKRPRLTQSR